MCVDMNYQQIGKISQKYT